MRPLVLKVMDYLLLSVIVGVFVLVSIENSSYASDVHPHGELALTGYQSNGTQSAPNAAFLCVSFGTRLSMVKLEEDTFACAGIRLNQSVNLFQLCHPHMTVNGKASLKSNGAH